MIKANKKVLTQQEACDIFLPYIKENGKEYAKFKEIWARPAVSGERVVTETDDGEETRCTAKDSDMVIKSTTEAQEEYLLAGEKFKDRYEELEEKDAEWTKYKPTGKIHAAKFDHEKLNLPKTCYFIASWGEEMIIKDGDMIATPDQDEVYRIAIKEFNETYKETK